MKKSSIQDLVLAITYQCNSRCRMCNIWKSNQTSDLPLDKLSNLPSNLKNVNITGGEPFLRQDLPEIIKAVRRQCPKAAIIISSNGFATELITKHLTEIIKIDPAIGVAFSLDGIGSVHDEIRGIPEGYERVQNSIKAAKDLGIKNLRIAFTLGDYNISELKKVYGLSRELKIEMTIAAVHSSENYFGKTNILDKRTEMAKELDWLIGQELRSWSPKRWVRAYFAFGLREFIRTGRRILPDYSGIFNIFVNPAGEIFPCDISSQAIGRLETGFENFKEISFDCEASWMICTARCSIRKHWFRAISWIIKNKLFFQN